MVALLAVLVVVPPPPPSWLNGCASLLLRIKGLRENGLHFLYSSLLRNGIHGTCSAQEEESLFFRSHRENEFHVNYEKPHQFQNLPTLRTGGLQRQPKDKMRINHGDYNILIDLIGGSTS